MRVRVKICGIRNEEDAFRAIELGADALGFIFAASPRQVTADQARRIMVGLEKFEKVILDFKKVESIGQAFADEIFRVWKSKHPRIKIEPINTNENVSFMLERAVF